MDPWWRDFGGPALATAALIGAWAWIRAQRKLRAAEAVKRRLEAKAVRYLLDAARHLLYHVQPHSGRVVLLEELATQKALIDQVRDELWAADGHPSERFAERQTEAIMRVLTRTQRIEAAEARRIREVIGGRDD